MKKILTLLFAMVTSINFIHADFVQSVIGPTQTITYHFYTESHTAEVVGYEMVTGSAVIPEQILWADIYYTVTGIGEDAFWNCTDLTSIAMPDLLERIGDFAFGGCINLTNITFPFNRLQSIGKGAFSNCIRLTSLTIPNSVTSIGEGAFWNCSSLTSLTIPNSVTSIEKSAFYECSGLTSVTIPNSVKSIGGSAFSGCSGLTSVTIPNSVKSIGEDAFDGCNSLTRVDINDLAAWCAISFGSSTANPLWYAHNLYVNEELVTDLVIPNGVTSIGNYAFQDCTSLTSVTIPNSVTSIGDYAFYDCTGLTSLIIGNSVTSIGDEAFSGCTHVKILVWEMAGEVPSEICSQMTELTDITIGEDVTSIEKGTFDNCMAISSIVWNARNCPTIEDENTIFPPFDNSIENITSFTFGEEVEIIPVGICSGMENLTSMTIPNSVTSIGDGAFSSCTGLTSVTIGNSVTSIGDWAFYECSSLTSATIGNSVTSIGDGAFEGCSGLTSVTIGNSVTSIGDGAFDWCSGLTSVNITDIAAWCNITFSGIDSNPLYYAEHLYVNNVEVTNLVIPNSVTSIGDYAFSCCSSLTSVTIPNSVTSIGEGAFYRCTGLTSVTIPNSVTSIGEEAFRNCTRLSSVTIEADIPPTLGHYVFDGEEYFPLTYPIYVPCNAVNAYKTAWSDYADRIVANCSSFTISFVNWDGSNLQTLSVAEGEMPQYTGSTPTRPDDEEYTYTFLGWTPAIVAVTEDATYTATYTATPKGQGIEEVPSDQVPSTKVLRNGILFIERGEKVYTLQGQEAQ